MQSLVRHMSKLLLTMYQEKLALSFKQRNTQRRTRHTTRESNSKIRPRSQERGEDVEIQLPLTKESCAAWQP